MSVSYVHMGSITTHWASKRGVALQSGEVTDNPETQASSSDGNLARRSQNDWTRIIGQHT